ncbi:hypothetical protein T4B_14154 [Trichinella pseudospiralis]|uniref:Uncharacterized protein n=1 Tax=Trichinella pseudospiralis TaxID=6337 RepID=A0A0V1KBY0_TRIPS|nr:hypothetical protein T4A_8327 [Trichinella pseudospiralis]KRZ23679.1 hypothetical protein T4B_14154 [Trichinella pseudospiralis]KRZ44711.1 hypothetical protein T4C_3483 [Trichinella pseudospiralis]
MKDRLLVPQAWIFTKLFREYSALPWSSAHNLDRVLRTGP